MSTLTPGTPRRAEEASPSGRLRNSWSTSERAGASMWRLHERMTPQAEAGEIQVSATVGDILGGDDAR